MRRSLAEMFVVVALITGGAAAARIPEPPLEVDLQLGRAAPAGRVTLWAGDTYERAADGACLVESNKGLAEFRRGVLDGHWRACSSVPVVPPHELFECEAYVPTTCEVLILHRTHSQRARREHEAAFLRNPERVRRALEEVWHWHPAVRPRVFLVEGELPSYSVTEVTDGRADPSGGTGRSEQILARP